MRVGWSLMCLLALPPTAAVAAGSHPASAPARLQVIAYVFPHDRVLNAQEIPARKLTRINYAFANIQDGRIVTGSAADGANLAMLHALKQENPSLQILVSVGGWLWSGNFSTMALTADSRGVFIDSVVAFLGQYKLDGLDVDWEYPGMAGATNNFRPEDRHNYTLLLQELRERFRQEENTLGHPLLLSVAAGASTQFLAHTEMSRVQHYLDTVNLMAYDYYEPDSDKLTGNHAPLYTDALDPKHVSANRSVHEFMQSGVPAGKIVLGVPFYGHIWGGVASTNHGLFQPGSQVPGVFAGYSNITAGMLGHGYTRYWDRTAAVPYLYSEQKQQFVSYEDAESLAAKCAYVRRKRLAGVMFWDLSSDASGTLVNAIAVAFHGQGSAAGKGK